MGGSDWQQTKSRAKRYVKQIAAELIRLYSARMATAGHAFPPDTPWQRELEDAFAHVETPDQLSTIDEVKADMERPVPMDRLVCGDVGYGKTEIAVRAAFKAIQDGKQVAILCPTTLLVQQHANTFAERYAGFPVVVRALSRFQSDRDAKAVLDGLSDGTVDLVIGTHRILGREVRFKDLGLVVIDEEQRFGVEHKEQLKALRTSVDVLAMSATPIPRTLEMAVTGIREMSTLQTPPEERHPVLTYVGAYDEKTLTAAIRRELLREGPGLLRAQQGVDDREGRSPHPRARARGPHRGGPRQDGRAPPRAGRARLLGEAFRRPGLHHHRGDGPGHLQRQHPHRRAGRPARALAAAPAAGAGRARPRARVLLLPLPARGAAHRDRARPAADHRRQHRPRLWHAGGHEGPRDPRRRQPAGGEQSGTSPGSGSTSTCGWSARPSVLDRGDTDESSPSEIKIELPVDAHLPHDYVPHERLRLEMYKKVAAVADEAQLGDIEAELVDRYGAPPEPVRNLLRSRACARWPVPPASATSACRATTFGSDRFELRESQQLRLQRLYPRSIVKPTLGTILVPKPMTAPVAGRPLRDREVLAWAGDVIRSVVMDNVGQAARVATARS